MNGLRTRLICKSCEQYSVLKSNIAVVEEKTRLLAYLQQCPAPIHSCPTEDCPNSGRDVSAHPQEYHRFGRSAAGTPRYRSKLCCRTFSAKAKPAAKQRATHKNKTIYKHLVNKTPFKRICEVVEISSPTLTNCCLDSSSCPEKPPEKVPCSKRLYQMTKPSPSQYRILMRFLRRLRKRNSAPISRLPG